MRRFIATGAAVILTAASSFSQAESVDAQGLRQAQGELLLQLEQLRQETQALRGLMEELSFQLQEMSQDQKQRYLDLDERLGELVRVQRDAQTAVSTTSGAPAPVVIGGTANAASDSGEPSVSDQDAYNQAFELIRAREFDQALSAMANFIQTYPDSPLVLDARFWRGQVFDVQGQDANAIEEFRNLTLLAPDYRRILQVKVKLGKLLVKNQDLQGGRAILQEVINQAPDSVEAGLAQRELEAIN